MSECQRCDATSPNAFLCARCQAEIRKILTELPWWLARLTEAAIGQTRMSDNGGRKSARRKDLDGDAELASCIEQLPNEDDLDKARRLRQKAALAHALATGGINAKASELLAEINDSLGYWVRVLCEARGLEVPVLKAGSAHGIMRAKWLAANITAIAASEDAGDISTDIEGHLDDIRRVVNRPIRMVYLGQCQTWIDAETTACSFTLRAPEDASEVYCPRCKHTHNCHRLLLELVDEAERAVVPFDELARTNRRMPTEYRVAPRTLRHWRATGILRPHQWRRPDGRLGLTQHSEGDVPLFSWADVKRLQLRKPQKLATGGAAHRDTAS